MKHLFPAMLLLGGCATVRQLATPVAAVAPPTKVVLRGTVANAGPHDTIRLFYRPVPGQVRHLAAKVPVGVGGAFELRIKNLAGPIDAQLSCGEFETVFLSPGDSLVVDFDRKQLVGTIRFAGRGAYVNTYLTRAQRIFDFDYDNLPERQFINLAPAEFRQRVDARRQQQLDTLAFYHARQPLPPALLQSRRQVLGVQHGAALLRYVAAHKRKAHREPQLPAGYYDFLAQLPLADYYYPTVTAALSAPLAVFFSDYMQARLLPPGGQLPTAPGTAERLYTQATADFGDTPARDYVLSWALVNELYSHGGTSLDAVRAVLPLFRARTRDS
ncbi:hypothetical protein, partial [Hymenobacter agri]